jgi:hypothetical protein
MRWVPYFHAIVTKIKKKRESQNPKTAKEQK